MRGEGGGEWGMLEEWREEEEAKRQKEEVEASLDGVPIAAASVVCMYTHEGTTGSSDIR